MSYVVTEACIGVKGEGCMAVCPENCIFTEPQDDMSYIDPARCTHCGVCMEACVIGAIYPDTEVPAASREFVALNEAWFRHKTGVLQRVRELAATFAIALPLPAGTDRPA